MTTVDEYLQAQPEQARATLVRVRAVLRKALPACTESVSYRIPTLKLDGRMVLYYAGFRGHWAIYPATERVRTELGKELGARLHSKGTIRFALGEVPARLVTRIAKLRAAEAAEANADKRRPGKKVEAKNTAATKSSARKTPARGRGVGRAKR